MTELLDALNSTTRAGSAEIALRRIDFDGERLMKLARAVANDYCRKHGMVLGDRMDDLVSVLIEAGIKAALKYDPARSQPGYSAASYLWDKMELAVEPDFLRRKREGFGDRRYGLDGLVTVSSEAAEAEADPEIDFDQEFARRRLARWQQAADVVGMTLSDFICSSMDKASRQVLRTAA